MRKAMVTAQRNADAVIAEAERKAAQIVNDAQGVRVPDGDAVVAQEQARIDCARETALNFVKLVEQDIKAHLELLETLKTRDMALEIKGEEKPAERKPFDFEDGQAPLVIPKAAESAGDIAAEIQKNLSSALDFDAPAAEQEVPQVTFDEYAPRATVADTVKFTNLQFGPKYDPTQR